MLSLRRVPAAVWWLVAWNALLLAVLSVVYPVWRVPDEPAHVDMVRWSSHEWSWPSVNELSKSRQITKSYELAGLVDRTPRLSPPLSTSPPERPPFDEIAPDEPSGELQQMPQHPPLYYVLLGRGVAPVVPDTVPFDTEVVLLRLASALLFVPVPLLVWLTARQVLGGRESIVAATVSCAVPQLSHISAGVNNDTLLVLLVVAMTPLLVQVARGRASTRVVVAASVLAGLAFLTKGFGFFTPLWLVVACWAGGVDVVRRSAIALGTTFVTGGWWLVRNVAVEGAIQPSGVGYPPPPAGFQVDLPWWLGFFWRRFTARFWIQPDIYVPWMKKLPELLTVALALLVVAGLVVLWRRQAGRVAVVLAVPVVSLLGLTVGGAFNYYRSVGVPYAVNGRYLFPAIAAIGVLVAAAVGRWRWSPPAAVAVAVALQALTLRLALDRYWEGVAAVRAWSPLPWALVVLSAVGLAVATAGLGVSVTAGTRRTPRAGRR